MANNNNANNNNDGGDEVTIVGHLKRDDRGGVTLGQCLFCKRQVVGITTPGKAAQAAVVAPECLTRGFLHVFRRSCLGGYGPLQGMCPICHVEINWEVAIKGPPLTSIPDGVVSRGRVPVRFQAGEEEDEDEVWDDEEEEEEEDEEDEE